MHVHYLRDIEKCSTTFLSHTSISNGNVQGNVKTIELQELSQMDDYGCILFQRPILFKRGDDMSVLTRGNSGVIEKMKLLGFVIEQIGDTVA